MLVSDFHYDLPAESIAQEPLSDRASLPPPASVPEKMKPGKIASFREFPDLLRPDDLLVSTTPACSPPASMAAEAANAPSP